MDDCLKETSSTYMRCAIVDESRREDSTGDGDWGEYIAKLYYDPNNTEY